MAEKLIVLNKDEDSVSIINPESGETETKIETGYNPHEVLISPDGSKTYVTCSLGGELDIIDNNTFEITERYEHSDFDFPHGLAATPDGSKFYLTDTYANKIFIFDSETDELLTVLDSTQKETHMVDFSPSGDIAYVANMGSNSISLIDAETEEFIDHIPVGDGPEGFGAHPNGKHLYVANQHENSVSIIDVETFEVLYERKVGSLPVRLMFSPDGEYALLPNRVGGDLTIIKTNFELTNALGPNTIRHANLIEFTETETPRPKNERPWEIKRIRVGLSPGGTVFDKEGSFAYVANNLTNDVSVIDMNSLKEARRIDAGIHPDGIAMVDR